MNFLELFNKSALIGAHRGARSTHPENTLSALKASIGHCDFIEIDVQLSSDEVAVIMHDDTLERTTNVSKIHAFELRKPYLVSDFSYEELLTLDYGSWFSRYEPLLTLSDALKFIKENEVYLNIEIKDIHKYFSDEKIVSSVFKEIENFDVETQVLISSFRHEYLLLCKEMNSNIPTAVLVAYKHPSKLLEYLKEIRVDAYHPNKELVDETTVKELKEAGFFVNAYTVDTPDEMQELFDKGVNGVFSNFLL